MVECRGLYKFLGSGSDALVARDEIFFLVSEKNLDRRLLGN